MLSDSWAWSTFANKILITSINYTFTIFLLIPKYFFFENSADPDQLAFSEASWSGSTLLSMQPVNQLYYNDTTAWARKNVGI